MKKSVKSLSLLLALIISFSVFAIVPSAESAVDGSGWMSCVSSDMKISEISIPGTHDSATQYVLLSIGARCQKLSIRSQLYAGVRFLDIRLEKHEKGYRLVHSFLDCKTGNGIIAPDLEVTQVLDECYDFLRKNPGETIIMCVKEDDGDAGSDFIDGFYNNFILPDVDKWYTQNKIPTLGDVRGKIIFARRNSTTLDKNNTGIDLSGWRDQGDEQLVPNTFAISGSEYTTVQDRYNLSPGDKWTAVKNMLESPLDKNYLNLNYLSSAYLNLPVYNAAVMNMRFNNYEIKTDYTGIVIFDFVTDELCEKIYTLNPLSAQESPENFPEKETPYIGLFSGIISSFDNVSEKICRIIASCVNIFEKA